MACASEVATDSDTDLGRRIKMSGNYCLIDLGSQRLNRLGQL